MVTTAPPPCPLFIFMAVHRHRNNFRIYASIIAKCFKRQGLTLIWTLACRFLNAIPEWHLFHDDVICLFPESYILRGTQYLRHASSDIHPCSYNGRSFIQQLIFKFIQLHAVYENMKVCVLMSICIPPINNLWFFKSGYSRLPRGNDGVLTTS
jgi:hypothetical protein